MNQQEAYDHGKANGYAAASYLDADAIGWASDELGYGDPDALDKQEFEEVAQSAAYEGELNARSYSPFEFFAHDINMSGNRAEGLWEKYAEGVTVGINKGVKELLKRSV